MRALLASLLAVLAFPSHAELPTERYAPAQLYVARDLLERARVAAAAGEAARAGQLAWQASLDARLAWAMTESAPLRRDAAALAGRASALIRQLTARP